ncbi:MAG: hypothetical protein JWL84_122 [Rhodospirillales bacterium]|nr:hypothetical protein [Rhodospirillales bacterium]
MRQRCYQPSHPSYPYYGAKGIRLCHDWLVYENFRDWALANGYREGLTVDRLDSACNYEPGNCEWVTLAVNIGRRNTQHAASQRKALLG